MSGTQNASEWVGNGNGNVGECRSSYIHVQYSDTNGFHLKWYLLCNFRIGLDAFGDHSETSQKAIEKKIFLPKMYVNGSHSGPEDLGMSPVYVFVFGVSRSTPSDSLSRNSRQSGANRTRAIGLDIRLRSGSLWGLWGSWRHGMGDERMR